MKNLEKKICAFVESLDSQDFDLDSQMTLLPAAAGPEDLPMTNRQRCRNEAAACGNTVNSGICVNIVSGCAGSSNTGVCSNSDLVNNPNTDSTKCQKG